VPDGAAASHQVLAKERFQRTDQNRLGHSLGPANGVNTEMAAINEIHVAMARRSKHYSIPLCQARRGVAGGIIGQVGFRLDNRSADWSFRRIANQPMAQQVRSDNSSRRLISGPRKRHKVIHLRAAY